MIQFFYVRYHNITKRANCKQILINQNNDGSGVIYKSHETKYRRWNLDAGLSEVVWKTSSFSRNKFFLSMSSMLLNEIDKGRYSLATR